MTNRLPLPDTISQCFEFRGEKFILRWLSDCPNEARKAVTRWINEGAILLDEADIVLDCIDEQVEEHHGIE